MDRPPPKLNGTVLRHGGHSEESLLSTSCRCAWRLVHTGLIPGRGPQMMVDALKVVPSGSWSLYLSTAPVVKVHELIEFLMKRTEPSTKAAFSPPL